MALLLLHVPEAPPVEAKLVPHHIDASTWAFRAYYRYL